MEAHGLRPTPRNNRCRGQSPARQLVRYLKKRDVLNQGLVWSSDSSLWGNQLKKKIITSFGQNQGLVWSSDSSLWGNQLQKIIITNFGQNQGLVWSSDSSLWENQLQKLLLQVLGQNQGLVWSSDPSQWEKPTTWIRKGLNFVRWAT